MTNGPAQPTEIGADLRHVRSWVFDLDDTLYPPESQFMRLIQQRINAYMVRTVDMPPDEAVWASVPYNYGPATRAHHAQRIGEDIAQRLRYPVEPEPYKAQLAAAAGHDTSARLGEIRTPTLIVHGEQDRMVPVANGERLAARIPGARLKTYPGAGHLYTTDEPAADEDVAAFLATL